MQKIPDVPLITVDGLGHRLSDGRWALKDISFGVPTGSFFLVAGANGSGKTTLFKHLNGLLQPTRGEIRLEGKSVAGDPAAVRRRVGLVFQSPDTQIVGETVAADVAFGPENLNWAREKINAAVQQALNATGLTALAGQRPHFLSGGEKRRLAIAGVLAMQPDVVVLDEPFSNLDWPGAKAVLHQLRCLHKAGFTIIICTHDVEKVLAEADDMLILSHGKTAAQGHPETLLDMLAPHGVRPPCSVLAGQGIQPWMP